MNIHSIIHERLMPVLFDAISSDENGFLAATP